MQESLCKSAWAYAVDTKRSMEKWMVRQAIEDLETVGLKNERLVLKSDQESSIVDVMKEIQKSRECKSGTAMDNSRVGDSDSNGTIESAIGSFEGVARTLRIALEEKIDLLARQHDHSLANQTREPHHHSMLGTTKRQDGISDDQRSKVQCEDEGARRGFPLQDSGNEDHAREVRT